MTTDILADKKFRSPGFWEALREVFLGGQRPLDCIQIEITSRCAAKCIYCPHTTQRAGWKSRNLEAQTLASLWPLLRASDRAHLQGWGEPLLHPHFLQFQKFCAKAGCRTSTTSSGLKMDMDLARQLAASGMDLMAFSLAGTDSKSNSARAGAPFEKVCESIKCLRTAIDEYKAPMQIHLAYLMLADRMDAVSRLPELMDRLNVEMAVISTLDYLALPEHGELAFALGEEAKLSRARELLTRAAETAAAYGRVIHYALPGNHPPEGGCRENIGRTLYVDAEGYISPCVYLNVPGSDGQNKRKVFGNALAEDALEIWNSQPFRDFRRELLANAPADVCTNCPKRVERASGI